MCRYVFAHVFVHLCMCTCVLGIFVCMYICMYMCVHMLACMTCQMNTDASVPPEVVLFNDSSYPVPILGLVTVFFACKRFFGRRMDIDSKLPPSSVFCLSI